MSLNEHGKTDVFAKCRYQKTEIKALNSRNTPVRQTPSMERDPMRKKVIFLVYLQNNWNVKISLDIYVACHANFITQYPD